MVERPLQELTHYDHLLDHISQLQHLYPNVEPRAGPSAEVNTVYLDTLALFENRLVDAYMNLVRNLSKLSLASTLGRKYALRLEGSELTPKISADCPKLWNEIQPLIRGTMELDGQTIEMKAIDCLDELERLVQMQPAAKALLTPFVAQAMGKVCVLQEAFRHLHANQPWYRVLRYTDEDDPTPDKLFGREDFDQFSSTLEVTMMTTGLYKMAIPDSGKFTFPVEAHWCDHTIYTVKAAELNFDMFWNSFDRVWDQIDVSPQFNLEKNSFRTPAFGRATRLLWGWEGQIRHEDDVIFQMRQTDPDVEECAIKLQVRILRQSHPQSRFQGMNKPPCTQTAHCLGENSILECVLQKASANVRTETTTNSPSSWTNLCCRCESSQGLPHHVLACF